MCKNIRETASCPSQGAVSVSIAARPISNIAVCISNWSNRTEVFLIRGNTSNGAELSATIVGRNAGELILPWVLAISQDLKIGTLASLIVPYPTLSEITKRAAGSYY
jgi:pyruvate/2-oxoglutarate dehydrogenase complex dihydrolipoamide dehydrogenase (E3) component